MISVLFKVKGQIDWHGLAVASDMTGLYWLIDEHMDPSYAEIKPVTDVSVCFRTCEELDEGESIITTPSSSDSVEISGHFLESANSADDWHTPDWQKIIAEEKQNADAP